MATSAHPGCIVIYAHVDHVTEANSTRNVIRTAGLNKLRMEDKRGEEHIKLSTEFGGKTQLNLGHNVDASRELRGEGAELRTDRHVSIRGGAGVFITADKQPFAGDKMLSMQEAIAEKDIRLQPGGAVMVDMPMEETAQYVAVAGMFMSPDQENNTWRVVLSRDDLDPDKARVIEAGNNRLTLQALKDE